MSQPFFSVVIPTRNRGAELYHTLRTCVAQDFDQGGVDGFEIVVSDNHSDDDIRAVVDRIASPRIRYIRTGRYLSMTESWEFAVAQARGRYVGIVGTDDGYLFDTLHKVHAIVARTNAAAVTFQGAYYHWPSSGDPSLRNKLLVPKFIFEAGLQDSGALIDDALRTLYYGRLPCFLNSFCSSDLLAEVRHRHGRIFDGSCPDVYSGFLLATHTPRVYVCNEILLIGGVSGASTGGNAYHQPQGEALKELSALSDPRDRPVPLVDYPFVATLILDSAAKALRRGGYTDIGKHIGTRVYLEHCYRQTVALSDPVQHEKALQAIRRYVEARPIAGLLMLYLRLTGLRWKIQARMSHTMIRDLQRLIYRTHGSTGVLANQVIDARAAGILNVYDAAAYLTRANHP